MKIHDVEQGTEAWLTLRLGIPTASEFDNIMTPAGKPSASARKYMARLIAEKLLNESMQSLDGLEWVERGKELEPAAVRMFEFETGIKSRAVGFITSDDARWGASPDRLLLDCTGLLEIKCPAPQTHMLYAIDGFGPAYKVQVQGQMLVAEADRAIRYSYHPRMQPVTTDTPRDEPFIRTLRDLLTRFSDEMDEHVIRLRASGFYDERAQIATPVDAAYDRDADFERTIVSYGDALTLRA